MKKLILITGFLFTALISNAATIYVSNTNDSGTGSLRAAVASANMGDIIRFNQSLISSGSDTIFFESPITINKGLFINGLYNTTDTLFFSGAGISRMLDINIASTSTFGNIDLDSLVFIDGFSSSTGGAINYMSDYNPNARLYIRNCIFRNNSSSTGGAIYSYKTSGSGTGSNYTCNITVEYSTFKNNTSTYSSSNGGGGAIQIYRYSSTTGYAVGIDLVITGCNFINNRTSARGGAIYAYVYAYAPPETGVSKIDINSSSFVNNEATHFGGALYSYSFGNTSCEAHSTSSTWIGNTTVGSGGACYLESTSHDTYFDTDFSTFYGNTAFVDGSALYLKSDPSGNFDQSKIEAYGSIFAGNGGNINYQNTIYQSASTNLNSPFSSSCYNIFDFHQNHLIYYQEYFPDASDSFNQTLTAINLAPLTLNPKGTYTLVPNLGSIAINMVPTLEGEAQNAPILGLRDIGAAESPFCDAVPVSENASICPGSTYDFYGQNLTSAGTYTHNIVTPEACDTLVTLTLTMQTAVTPSVTIASNPGNTIMTGTMVTFTATPVNGGSNPSYQWFINGNPTGPNAPSVQTSGLINNAVVSCTMTSNHACTTTSTDQSNTITFNVHANNDEPCNSITLGVNETCQTEYFANHIATNTTNVGAHTCANSTSKDIWFKFAAPASGNVYIYTYAGTLLDAVMSVYQGNNCSSLFEVGCVDDDGTNQMPQGVVTGATPGQMIYVRVSSYGTTNSGNFGICIVDMSETNTNPLAVNDAFSATMNTPTTLSVLANDSDAENGIVTSSVSIITPSPNGTAVVNANGTITFTPNNGFTGVTTLVYEVCDNGTPSLCATATVTITISPAANVNPTAANDVTSTAVNTATTINVLSNDFDTDGTLNSSTLDIAIQSNNGTAIVNSNGTITFTPNAGFTGVTTFVYEICDNGSPALCATATVTITVSVIGIEEQTISTRIYPNPVKTILNIESTKEITSYKIITLDGKLVAENTNADGKIDVQFYSAGIYLLELKALDGTVSRTQFVKE
jgi:hypothetical protein